MSDFKRWTDEDSDASTAERALLAAGSTKELALGADRKAELRRALAIAIALPLPPDGSPSEGSPGGPPPPPAAPPPPPAPPVPPPLAETAGVLGSVGKLVFSGKASGALLAFALAAGGTAGVLGVATLTNEGPPLPPSAATPPHVVKKIDDPRVLAASTALPEAAAVAVSPSAVPPEPTPAGVARPARSLGEKAVAEIEAPLAPLAPAPSEASANAPVAAPPSAPPSAAVLVIPAAPDVRLADEIARVRAARDALRSGDTGLALTLLDALDRAHPAGTLGQEREAMRIEALANAGRTTEARARADAFLARHRGSAFASSVRRFATP